MSARNLKVLIHGAGWVATQHAAAWKQNPNAQVVGVSSRRLDKVERFIGEFELDARAYDSLERALDAEDPDIVSICTPQYVHMDNIRAVAAAGKHMVIEKPAVVSLEELREARDLIREAGVKTVVSFVLRWNPLFQTLKTMLADDAFGNVYHVEADYQSFAGSWWGGFADNRQVDTGIGAFLLAGCHAIDAVRWFAAGGRPEAADATEVFAWKGGYRKGSSLEYDPFNHRWHEGLALEYDGLEIALLRFGNGVTAKVSVNFDCIQPYSFPLRIFGDKGTVRDNRVYSQKFPGQRDWVEIPAICPDSSDVTHHPFQAEIDHFVQCVLDDRESHCNYEDAVRTHEIVFACQQCYETNQPVSLPLLGD